MAYVEPFALANPRTLGEAVAVLATTPNARLLAGGTDLLPNLRHGLGATPVLVDMSGIPELRAVRIDAAGISIGACVTLSQLAHDTLLARALPAVAEAAASVAGPAHRSAATLGGNLCLDTRCAFYNQSAWWRAANDHCLKHGGDTCHVAPQGRRCHAAFSGDLAPALLVLDASVDVAGPRATRTLNLAQLYVEDGAAHLALARGEIVVAIRVPPQPSAARAGYRKARVRGAIDFPLAGVAARVEMQGSVLAGLRVALTGTNARPFLLEGTQCIVGRPLDDALVKDLGKLVQAQASPVRTTVMQPNYRRQVAAVLAQRLVRELASPRRTRDGGT